VLLNASGCLDALTAPEVARSLDAFVTKTVTPLPRGGNAPVRIAETEVGMLNSIGLANPGRERFLTESLPRLRELGVPLWVSVGGFTAAEYAETCALLDDVTIELNLSCPNVDEAPESAAEIVAACRAATGQPLYAKLSAATADVAGTARAVEAAGADGLSLVNTIRGLALDEHTLRPSLSTAVGGLSGPALRPVALAAVWACYRATSLPIVGMGGVVAGRDALDLIAVGATDVALGTVLFADPEAPARIRRELDAEAAARGFDDPIDARGAAQSGEPDQRRSLDDRSRVEGQKGLEFGRNMELDPRDSGVSIPRRGLDENAGPGAGPLARPTHGRA
jgi:dihydroorotate dehydrogenase (NAD+) catalytic subunit